MQLAAAHLSIANLGTEFAATQTMHVLLLNHLCELNELTSEQLDELTTEV